MKNIQFGCCEVSQHHKVIPALVQDYLRLPLSYFDYKFVKDIKAA